MVGTRTELGGIQPHLAGAGFYLLLFLLLLSLKKEEGKEKEKISEGATFSRSVQQIQPHLGWRENLLCFYRRTVSTSTFHTTHTVISPSISEENI